MFKGRSGSFAIIALLAIIVGLVCVAMKVSRQHTDIFQQMQSVDWSQDGELHRDRYPQPPHDSIQQHISFEIATPIRSTDDKIQAMERFIHGQDGELVIFHYAGGCKSTLSEWFNRIQSKLQRLSNQAAWNSSITHIDIDDGFHEDLQQYLRENARDKLMMICFHDPIKRILAQYDKQWRWGPGCQAARFRSGCGANIFMQEYNQSLLHTANYLSLTENNKHNIDISQRFASIDANDMLYRVIRFEIEQRSSNPKLYHMFINNHYLWSFCCRSAQCSMLRDIESRPDALAQCLDYSRQLIQAFDVVFVKEWISDLRVQHYVNELFFTDNNVDDQRNKFVAVAQSKPSAVSRMGQNYMLDPRYEELLLLLNKHDISLYEWIRDLVFNRTHIVWQQAKYNKRHRNELVYDLGYKYIIEHSQEAGAL